MRPNPIDWLAPLGFALGACTPAAVAPAPDTGGSLPTIDAPGDDGPYLDDPEAETPPGLEAAEIAAAVDAVLPLLIGVNAGPVRDAYAEILADQSSGCPTWAVTEDDVPYWFDACTAEGGTRFDGYAYSVVSDEREDGDILWSGWQFYGLATIERPDGAVFEAPGAAGVLIGAQSGGARVTYTYMDEGFRYSGETAGAAWLGEAGSPQVAAYTVYDAQSGGRLVSLEATVRLDEGPIGAVVLDGIQLGNAEAGSPCPDEPSGLISVRSAEGDWIELYFDGLPIDQWGEGGGAGAACDGCAEAWADGVEIGEVCIDASVLTDWGEAPWALPPGD